MAEGHPCVTHDNTNGAGVVFGHDKSTTTMTNDFIH